ncbi:MULTISPECIES: hypothetical protein [Streptomyces]|uniref:hypothetical protein n=1 Tax=Streptomyces tendae TaxID=1932 RepID=UPI0038240BA6
MRPITFRAASTSSGGPSTVKRQLKVIRKPMSADHDQAPQVVKEMLGDSSYCTRARNLAEKAATAPPAVGMVPLLEELVAGKG